MCVVVCVCVCETRLNRYNVVGGGGFHVVGEDVLPTSIMGKCDIESAPPSKQTNRHN